MISIVFIAACGVKGDPVPPQAPPPIGRGKPSYSKATMTLPGGKRKMPQEKDWVDEEEEKEKKLQELKEQQEESNENEN